MLKLPKTTEYIKVRRYRLVATNDLAAKFERNIEAENKIYNYVLKYLEKTYGVKHLKRPYPTNKNAKLFLAKDVLIPKILKDLYGLSKWDGKKVGIHSQALRDEYLVSILTNFGKYRKNLNNIKYIYEHENLLTETWYVIKVLQEDNKTAVSSPIFINHLNNYYN